MGVGKSKGQPVSPGIEDFDTAIEDFDTAIEDFDTESRSDGDPRRIWLLNTELRFRCLKKEKRSVNLRHSVTPCQSLQ